MTSDSSTLVASGLVDRIKHIILQPKLEWPVIEAEQATVKSIYLPYAVLLTAIGPLAGLVGSQVFPLRVFGVVYRPDLVSSLYQAGVGMGLALLAVFLVSLITDALAPSFGGSKDRVQATKVAVYSMTPAWIAGIFNFLPSLAWLGSLLGLYSFYLLYLGLPGLMKSSQDKAVMYAIVIAIAVVIILGVVGGIVGSIVTINTLAGTGPFVFG